MNRVVQNIVRICYTYGDQEKGRGLMKEKFPFKKEYEKLELLLSQGQFELILPEGKEAGEIRLVYLMNDAVESFLVFCQVKLTGTYLPDFQGELWADLDQDGDQYVLVVHQEATVCTLFFRDLKLEVHLFDYGKTGHFWVKGYEYLRQLEYRIAILRDKREYLGEEFCSQEERRISSLAEFPPLNFCCYPAVSEKYLVPSCSWWQVSEEALLVMTQLAEEAGDKSLKKWLRLYQRIPVKCVAKQIARMLHKIKHAEVVDLLNAKLSQAASAYERRDFGTDHWNHPAEKQNQKSYEEDTEKIRRIQEKAEQRKKQLEKSGKQVEMLTEEPFLYVKDSVEYKIHLMIWKQEGKNRKVEVETID